MRAQTIPIRMYVYINIYMCISSKNDFPIPGRDLITPISNIAQVPFPRAPIFKVVSPKCHDEHIVQKWVFIYLARNTQKSELSTLKWGHGGISFLGHVYGMGVIKSRPGTLLDPDFLIETHNSPKSAKTLHPTHSKNTNGQIAYRSKIPKTHSISPFS